MHVHILGICGTFMGGIAALAREAGHRVTGSDANVYPPMSTQLEALGIEIVQGYGAEQLALNPDEVVVGNVMTRGMPVIEALLDSEVPFSSGPAWLAEHILPGREVIAVAGTHGKTTTTSMVIWILEQAGLDPGFLVGGVPGGFGVSARKGEGRAFVVEADEYDTAFFDKRAKFVHYRPHGLVINNIEFDHADIYADVAAIRWQFHQLVRTVPGGGSIICNARDPEIDGLLEMGCWTPVTRFASSPGTPADWHVTVDGDALRISGPEDAKARVDAPLPGQHNAENALAAVATSVACGVSIDAAAAALSDFPGVRRRLDLLGTWGRVEVFDDFAHHPTAIRRTIDAVRLDGFDGRILVALEPRSNTMRAGLHGCALGESLSGADMCWVHQPADVEWDVASALTGHPGARVVPTVDGIVKAVTEACRAGDRILIMSNGAFGGIQQRLSQALEERYDDNG